MAPNRNGPWRPVEDPLDRLSARSKDNLSFHRREEMLMPDKAAFDFLEAAQIRFSSMKERSVKLSYGVFYEQLYEEGGCGKLEGEIFDCMAIGIESSRHQGHLTEYLIMVQMEGDEKEDDMSVLPKLDKEDVDLEVDVKYDIPDPPRHAFTEAWLADIITDFLRDEFGDARNILGQQNADPEQLKARMMTIIGEVYADDDDSTPMAFLKGAAEAMEHVSIDLNAFYRQGESLDPWKDKIEAFVEEHIAKFKHPPIKLYEDPTLRATRIEVPEALRHVASALFVATAPRIPRANEQDAKWRFNWPREEEAGPPPFLRFRIPVIEAGVDLAATADMAEKLAKADEKSQSTKTFEASIVRTTLDTTMKMELAAIAKLTCNEQDTSEVARLSRYLLDFRGEIQTRDATATFPALKAIAGRAIAAAGASPPEEAEVFPMNTLSQVLASIAAPLRPLLRRSDTVDVLRQEFRCLDEDQKAVFSSLESLPYGMLNVVGAAGTGKTHVCLLIVIMACLGMVVDDDDSSDDSSDDDGEISMPQALVCGVTNAQVNEVCERFDHLINRCQLPLEVVRLGTIGRELANAISKGVAGDETAVFDSEPASSTSGTFDDEVSRIMSAYHENKEAQAKIHGGVYSVSEIAYAKLDSYRNGRDQGHYSGIVGQLRSLYETRKDFPSIFDEHEAERYRQLWKELIVEIIENADIVVATPVAAKQLADMRERPFEPKIIWSDDVGGTTEASALAPLAFFPEARLRILSGDPESEVVTPSLQAARKPKGSKMHFVNRYARQLGTSIIERMERGGAPVARLRVGHDGASGSA
ncbi:hypothetical protein PG988_010323 [Apiospora saccharicola]